MPADGKEIRAQGEKDAPEAGEEAGPTRVGIDLAFIGKDDVVHLRNQVLVAAFLFAPAVAVAHQDDFLPPHFPDAMKDVMVGLHLCQYNISFGIGGFRKGEFDAVYFSPDERQHTVAFGTQGYVKTLTDIALHFSQQERVGKREATGR